MKFRMPFAIVRRPVAPPPAPEPKLDTVATFTAFTNIRMPNGNDTLVTHVHYVVLGRIGDIRCSFVESTERSFADKHADVLTIRMNWHHHGDIDQRCRKVGEPAGVPAAPRTGLAVIEGGKDGAA